MSFFVAELDKDDAIADFAVKCRNPHYPNAKVEMFVSMFMNTDIKLRVTKNKVFWSNLFKIKMPPIYLFSLIFAGLYIIFGSIAWLFFAFAFLLAYVPFSRTLHVWAFKKGLKKAGYKGSIRILSLENGIEEVLFR